MKATRTPVRTPQPWAYVCERCGITKTYGGSSNGRRPTMCQDCRDVLSYRDLHGTVAGWSSHHRNREYPVCEPCRLAYNANRRQSVDA